MISNVEEQNGLYYLTASPSRSSPFKKLSLSSVSNSNIFLWHNHFSHPNFTYLKYLYLDLLETLDKEAFQSNESDSLLPKGYFEKGFTIQENGMTRC